MRKDRKQELVEKRIEAMASSGNLALLVKMLDEWKLDALLIALGDGEVVERT